MPLFRISDYKPKCISEEHNPPTHYCYAPGEYVYICPRCNKETRFSVPGLSLFNDKTYIFKEEKNFNGRCI